MTKVPEYSLKPLKPIWNPSENTRSEYASLKQKNIIATLHERRGLPVPYMKYMKKGEAAQIISSMLN